MPPIPCSEYMFVNDSACNLASLNLMKFRNEDGSFDVESFKKAIRLFIIAQEILVDNGSYPEASIAENSHLFRPLGLGYANLGSLMMSLALPYDSDQARAWAAAITAIMTGTAYTVSAELAAIKGPFDDFEKNKEPMLNVIAMHREHAHDIPEMHCPDYLLNAAKDAWDQAFDAGHQDRLPQCPDHRAGPDRHHRLYDGLRYHRRRAGHRTGQIQTARRRRNAQARQQDRSDGPGKPRLQRRGNQRHLRLHRQRRYHRNMPTNCEKNICRSSTVPSRPKTANDISITWPI